MSTTDTPRGRPPSTVKAPPNGERIVARVIAHDGDALALSFEEIAALIGEPLPLRWRTETGKWNANRGGRSLIKALRAAGWRSKLDYANRRVVFRREGA
jgi:hypothetical protein